MMQRVDGQHHHVMKGHNRIVLLLNASLFLGLINAYNARLIVAQSVLQSPPAHQEPERHYGRLTIKAARGFKVTLGNRTTGRITVNGWDRDVIEAHSISERGDEVVIVTRREDPESKGLLLKADYANLDQASAPTRHIPTPPTIINGEALKVDQASAPTRHIPTPPIIGGKAVKVHLEVNLPRNTEIDLIQVWQSEVQVSGMDTPITVAGDRSSVILKRVAGVAVRTRSGNVEVENASGTVEVSTTSGAVRVHNVTGLVRVISISGPIEIKCSRGRTQVANTEAPIELINVDGEVDAVATNSSVRFTGRLREDGRYDLKSMSGRVEMILPGNTHGFDATLSSYRGVIESDFNLNTKNPISDGKQQHRLIRRFGNGKARIRLDSFDGFIRLTKGPPGSMPGCM